MATLDKFFDKINFENREIFSNTKLNKVEVNKLDKELILHIENEKPLPVENVQELKLKTKNGFGEEVKSVKWVIKNNYYTDEDIFRYFSYFLKGLCLKSPSLKSVINSKIVVKNKVITLEIANAVEEDLIKRHSEIIINWFLKNGFPEIKVETIKNDEIRKQVKKEIESIKSKFEKEITSKKEMVLEKKDIPSMAKTENILFGLPFEDFKITKIGDINSPKRGVIVQAKISNIDLIESTRSDYKIFNITIEDESGEIPCKLFTTDNVICNFLNKELKPESWYKFRGTISEDSYLKTLSLTIRAIMKVDDLDETETVIIKKTTSSDAEDLDYDNYADYENCMPDFIPEYNECDIPAEDYYKNDNIIDASFFGLDSIPIDMNVPKENDISLNNLESALPNNLKDEINIIKDENPIEQKKETIKKIVKNENKVTTEKKVENKNIIKEDGIILGSKINTPVVNIKNIQEATNSVCIEATIFAVDLFESPKTGYKILTLKLTDKTDSLLAKIFTKNADEFKKFTKELKPGNWFKLEGNIKFDEFSKDLVLTPRNIQSIPSKDELLKDDAAEKRVELHTHTMMSQMDGVLEVNSFLKDIHKMGYRAVAITDHNGVQAFPDAFHKVTDFNRGIEKEEDKFKVIYGAEMTMIEDTIGIVKRPIDESSIDATYCVFDLETTGFNAGGGDQIIEIGAVLIQNGEIISRFDELINPGRPLPKKITEITNITDEMLSDKEDEETVVKRFIEFFKDYPMVAHNAKFDTSFLEMAYEKYNLGEFTNCVIDTLELSRVLDSGFARHSLSALVKRYNVEWDENAHHRADYDAEGTAKVFAKMNQKMYDQNIKNINAFNGLVSTEDVYKFGRSFHINLLAKNKTGLKNLFKLISLASTKYLWKTPRILRSEIEKHRDGLLIGSGCYESEVFISAKSKSDEELSNIISFYDYVEVQPPLVYSHLLDLGDFSNNLELENHIKKIIETTKNAGKIIVATGDVHHYKKEDKISREIIVNQKVPGGGRHPLAKNEISSIPSQHFRTTDEMLKDFSFLENDLAKEIVVTNTNKIADMCEIIEVIIDTNGVPFSPKIENSVEEVKSLVYGKAKEIYGENLPTLIEERINNELKGIIKGGFDVIYLIAQKLVKHSNDEGYLVGSRGSVGSSFVATMMGITEVNPLPAHYVCPKCKYSEFEDANGDYSNDYSCGYDLPDKKCPKCGESLSKQGQDMPFATFLGFDADKVPDIDLNFSGDNQSSAHEYTKVLFGVDNVYRAGTISTVADKTAFGFVKGYCENKNIFNMRNVEMERLAIGCTGVKRTTGQHPGGIVVVPGYMEVFDFTPFQYPADDLNSPWRTTHFDYHAIDQDLLKLDMLGHDDPTVLRMIKDLSGMDVTKVPLDDKDTMKIFTGTEILGITPESISSNVGTLGIPEFGTKNAMRMLEETKPTRFAELVKISGLSHGTDVWYGNARDLILENTVEFKDVIGCRDDIMINLINYGLEPKKAFKIMEFVRKGKASKDLETWAGYVEDMKEKNVPFWYINSCAKIKYMFPKAHAAAYVISAYRIAWFKVHKPIYFYASYFSVRTNDFEISTMCAGYEKVKQRLEEINEKGYDAGVKEASLADELWITLEMYARGFKFKMIDLYKSDSKNFIIDEDGKSLIFPFRGLDGLGENVANLIVKEREKAPFLSIEDVQSRAKVNSTTIEKMRTLHIFDGMSESNQLSLFD